jgi:hypothetical protein
MPKGRFGYRINFNSLHSILICTKISNVKASDLLPVIHLLSNHQFGCLQVGIKGLKGYKGQNCLFLYRKFRIDVSKI